MTHFDEITAMLYLDGQLEPDRAAELLAHAGSCPACHALLGSLERESHLLRRALVEADEPVPARLLAPAAQEPIPWAWIVSFGFASAGAYTLWTGLVEPWRQQLTQAGFGGGNLLAMLFFGGVFWKGWQTMLTLVQVLAFATLSLLTGALLGRTRRRLMPVGMILASLAALLALPQSTAAAEIQHGRDSYTLPAGKTVSHDIIVATRTAHIEGTIEGDLIVFAESVTVTGHVTGDVIGFARRIRITGQVDGNFRGFANSLSVIGSVSKNINAFCEFFELDSKGQAGGSLLLFTASSTLDGRVARDVTAFAGNVELNSFIGGDADMTAERLAIGPGAEIKGSAKFKGEHQPQVNEAAKLASPLKVEIMKKGPEYASPRFYWRQALRWGAGFVFGLVVLLLMPGFFRDVVRSGDRIGTSLGFGIISLVSVPVLAILGCITLVGLAVGIGMVLLYIIALYASHVFAGAWLGERVLGQATARGAMLGRLAVGLLILRVVGHLPYIGGLFVVVACLLGLGAVTLALYFRVTSAPATA